MDVHFPSFLKLNFLLISLTLYTVGLPSRFVVPLFLLEVLILIFFMIQLQVIFSLKKKKRPFLGDTIPTHIFKLLEIYLTFFFNLKLRPSVWVAFFLPTCLLDITYLSHKTLPSPWQFSSTSNFLHLNKSLSLSIQLLKLNIKMSSYSIRLHTLHIPISTKFCLWYLSNISQLWLITFFFTATFQTQVTTFFFFLFLNTVISY